MKTLLALLLALIPLAAGADTNVSLTPLPDSGLPELIDISSFGPELTSIVLRNPLLATQTLDFNGQPCDVSILEGEPFCPNEGSPAVPQVTRLYRIPNTGNVELVVRHAQYETIADYHCYPYHDPDRTEVRLSDDFRRDTWYPSEIAQISAPMIFRDYRVVAVTLFPVQVNPVSNQARHYSNIEIDIVATGGTGTKELLVEHPPSPRYQPIYRDLIRNFDEDEFGDSNPLPGAYYLLARFNNSVNPWVDSIATWRRLSGYEVVVEQRANWTVTQLQTAIRDAWSSWLTPPEYICLMGDPSSSFGLPTHGTEYDHYFAKATDGDELEDFGVGRMPAQSAAEFAAMFSKLTSYERTPWMQDSLWFHRALLSASVDRSLASNATFCRWADQQFRMHTGLDSNIVFFHTGQLPRDTIRAVLNAGVGLFFWRGSWIGEIGADFAGQLQTNRRLPVAVFLACATDVIAANFVRAGTAGSPKGAVCAIGEATAGSHALYNISFAGGLTYSLANQHIEHVTHAMSAGKAWLTAAFGQTNQVTNHQSWINYLGDPAIRMWTETPTTMNVKRPLNFPIGSSLAGIEVRDSVSNEPISDAVVVLWKGSFDEPEFYTRAATDDSGRVSIPVQIDSTGSIRLAVTKHNCKPYIVEISCDSVDVHVTSETVFVDDNNTGGTHGNNDQLFNPGETIDLLVQAHNFGTTGTGVSTVATLYCDHPGVTIDQRTSVYPPLGPDQTAQGDVPFRLTLASSVPDQDQIPLRFMFVTGIDTSFSMSEFLCNSPRICFSEVEMWDSLGPGGTARFRLWAFNGGTIGMEAVEGTLTSLTPYVRVTSGHSIFGDLSGPTPVHSQMPFSATADSAAFRGQQAEMQLAIVDEAGFRDSVTFTLSIGQKSENDPAGPDPFGYYGFDNTDSLYSAHPVFDYLDISGGLGEDLELEDNGESVDHTIIWSTLVELPFPFTYYGASYNEITVCSNGWLAFGDQSWNDCFRNFPLPGILSASNMVAPYWDDLYTAGPDHGVYTFYDQAEARFVVQWKAQSGGLNYDQAQLDFEVVLLDTAEHPTRDGNGKFLFLYQDVEMNLIGPGWIDQSGCTIGIQDSTSLFGLQYAYVTNYSPGAAPMVDGTAILFTTDGPTPLDTVSAVVPLPSLPNEIVLRPNYPNPFNPSTNIQFDLNVATHVTLSVFDVTGRLVSRLADEVMQAGRYTIAFDGNGLSSGVYFCRLQTPAHVQTQKMVLLK